LRKGTTGDVNMYGDEYGKNIILSARGVSKSFPGGVVALDNVSLDLYAGEVLALLGENGSGKSTLIKILYGVYIPDHGEIYVRDQGGLKKTTINSPVDAMSKGIVMVSQVPQLVDKLTIVENISLTLASLRLHGVKYYTSTLKVAKIIEEELNKIGIKLDPNERVYNLTYTQKQLVEILRGIIINARIILIDEALTYLPVIEKKKFYQIITSLRDTGRSIVLVTHKIPEAMEISNRIAVLRAGKLVDTVYTREVTPDHVRTMMFGEEKAKLVSYSRLESFSVFGNVRIAIRDLHVEDDYGREAVKGINLTVRAGEVVGIAGITGNGQRELLEAIVGLREIKSGEVYINGVNVKRASIRGIRELGIGFIPDRLLEHGVSLEESISENIAIMAARKGLIIPWDSVDKISSEVVNAFQIVTPSIKTPTKYLSGGNLLKVIVARELENAKMAFIAYNPTRTLDEVSAIYVRRRIKEKATSRGIAVLLISEDLDEVLMTSDTIYVINSGRLCGPLPPETPRDEIEKLMVM
jgi:simple sugar transport system ATP-binding protein